MQTLEYLEQKRTGLRTDLQNTLDEAREHIRKEETELRDRQVALNEYVKTSQRRVSQLEGAIMGLNEALADPQAQDKADKPAPVKQPDSAVKPDAPTKPTV